MESRDPSLIQRSLVRERCRRPGGLKEFIKRAWHILEPESRPFVDNWHIDCLCEHLEAVTLGLIPLLVFNVPPGTMKSLIVSVFWPSWEWGPAQLPHLRYMTASYSKHLSMRDARKARQVIESPWYQYHWGDIFTLSDDQNAKTNYVNDKNGHRVATSVGGVGTGERGDRNIIDDPHNILKTLAVSRLDLKKVREWWDNVMPTRTNDLKSATVVVMQRVNQGDLTGVIEEQGDALIIKIPMEYELGVATKTFLRPKSYVGKDRKLYRWDPRRKKGELLDPVRFPKSKIKKLKKRLGSFGTAGQLQQRPTPREGGIIQIPWFQRYRYSAQPERRKFKRIVQSWDSANKEGQQNAYSVCETWGQLRNDYYLLDVLRIRVNIPTLHKKAQGYATTWKPHRILVEDKASGTGLIAWLREETRFSVFGVEPETDKITRMDLETPTIEAGRVFIPEDGKDQPDWLEAWIDEHRLFPNSLFMDQVDSTSQFLKWARENGHTQDWNLY